MKVFRLLTNKLWKVKRKQSFISRESFVQLSVVKIVQKLPLYVSDTRFSRIPKPCNAFLSLTNDVLEEPVYLAMCLLPLSV